ncbi:MAG: hypothetical protein NDJ89_13200 [Oligoflexia bacterium]|nr:hypothetical protein [Oligoflexia bacterium]
MRRTKDVFLAAFLLLPSLGDTPAHAAPDLIDYTIQCTIFGPGSTLGSLAVGYPVGPFGDFQMCNARSYPGLPDETVYVFASLHPDLDEGCQPWRNGDTFYLAIGYLEMMGALPQLENDYGQYLAFAKERLSPSLNFTLTEPITQTTVTCVGPEPSPYTPSFTP